MGEGKKPLQIVFYGASWCPDSQRVKHYFGEHNIAYEWHDIDDPKELKAMPKQADGSQITPTLVIEGQAYFNPAQPELEKLIGGNRENFHEVITVGAGPTALAAAIYTTREDIETLLLEKGVVGGLAAITDMVDNYPGFPEGIEGLALASNLRAQAERFGAKIEIGEVTKILDEGRYKRVTTTDNEFLAKAVLIATGSDYKQLGIPGEKEFYGRGVHYCATCDGAFYRDQRLVVVGGGNSAAQEALFLTKFASQIDMLVRGDQFRASDVLVKKIEETAKIKVHFNTTTDEIVGSEVDGRPKVSKVVGTDKTTGKKVEFTTDGVFVFVGLSPNTGFLKDSAIELDEVGFIKTDKTLETNLPGVFAAGDVRSGATMQIASAVGEGATAALMIREYLKEEG